MKRLAVGVVAVVAVCGGLVVAPRPAAAAAPAGCPRTIGWQIAGDPTTMQSAFVGLAVAELSWATGQDYRFDGTTAWVPQVGNIDAATDDLVIAVVPRDASTLLQVDGVDDDAYTWWTAAGHAGIALLDTTPPNVLLPLAMHELMLSRRIPEGPDPGGLLGHWVQWWRPRYSTADLAMLRGCEE